MNETVSFWAELWRPMEKNSHGESLVSPNFTSQPECVTWVRARKQEFDQVGMWMRKSREGSYEDIPLSTMDAPLPNLERLHALVQELKDMLQAKKSQLDKGGFGRSKPVPRPAQTMDPLETRQLAYDEVYDEAGNLRFPVDADGWPVAPLSGEQAK